MNTTDVINHLDEYHEKTKRTNVGMWHDESLEKEYIANEARRTDDLKWALCRGLKGLRPFPTVTEDQNIMGGQQGFRSTPKQKFLLQSMVVFGHPLTPSEIGSILGRIPTVYHTVKATHVEREYQIPLNLQYSGELLKRLKRAERWGLLQRLTDGKKSYYRVTAEGKAWVKNSSL